MIANWIFEENLLPWLQFIAGMVSYDLHPWELDYFETGIVDTSEDDGKWLDHEFSGNETIRLRLAKSDGSSVIEVEVECPVELEPKVSTAIDMAQEFMLVPRR